MDVVAQCGTWLEVGNTSECEPKLDSRPLIILWGWYDVQHKQIDNSTRILKINFVKILENKFCEKSQREQLICAVTNGEFDIVRTH